MESETKQHKTFRLNKETLKSIEHVAIGIQGTATDAVELLITRGLESTKNQSLSEASYDINLHQIRLRLKKIDSTLDFILKKLET
jgi:hypothetical protein